MWQDDVFDAFVKTRRERLLPLSCDRCLWGSQVWVTEEAEFEEAEGAEAADRMSRRDAEGRGPQRKASIG